MSVDAFDAHAGRHVAVIERRSKTVAARRPCGSTKGQTIRAAGFRMHELVVDILFSLPG